MHLRVKNWIKTFLLIPRQNLSPVSYHQPTRRGKLLITPSSQCIFERPIAPSERRETA